MAIRSLASVSKPNKKPLSRSGGRRAVRCRADASSFAALVGSAYIGEVLQRKSKGSLNAPVLAMLCGFLAGQAGCISSSACNMVWSAALPMAVSLSLLGGGQFSGASLPRMSLAFAIGTLGTIAGALVAWYSFGKFHLGLHGVSIACCLVASYIGGSINFFAVAKALGLTNTPSGNTVLVATTGADNLAMALFISLLFNINSGATSKIQIPPSTSTNEYEKAPSFSSSEGMLCCLMTAAMACIASERLSFILFRSNGFDLAITALVSFSIGYLAQNIPLFKNYNPLTNSPALSSVLMGVFFAAVGASADIKAAFKGGPALLLFIAVLLAVHLSVVLGIGSLLKVPTRELLLASNACVGGPATAAAMADAKGWKDLVQPSIFVGTVGYLIGTAIGLLFKRLI
jgi:uncharacterized membrane protein